MTETGVVFGLNLWGHHVSSPSYLLTCVSLCEGLYCMLRSSTCVCGIVLLGPGVWYDYCVTRGTMLRCLPGSEVRRERDADSLQVGGSSILWLQ